MQSFKSLFNFKATKTPQNTYILTIPHGNWEIDGEYVQCTREKRVIELPNWPEKVVSINYTREIDGYKDSEGNTLTVNEYKKQLKKLRSGVNEDGDFPDLDSEFAWRKFCEKWSPCFVDVEIRSEVEIEKTVAPVSSNKYITPLYQLLEKPISNPTCEYVPDPVEIFREIASELGFEEVKDGHPTIGFKFYITAHSGLKYVKLNNEYIYGSKCPDHAGFIKHVGLYSECVEKFEEQTKALREFLSQKKRFLTEKELSKIERKELHSNLKALETYIHSINPKANSAEFKVKARYLLHKILQKI